MVYQCRWIPQMGNSPNDSSNVRRIQIENAWGQMPNNRAIFGLLLELKEVDPVNEEGSSENNQAISNCSKPM